MDLRTGQNLPDVTASLSKTRGGRTFPSTSFRAGLAAALDLDFTYFETDSPSVTILSNQDPKTKKIKLQKRRTRVPPHTAICVNGLVTIEHLVTRRRCIV